MQENPKLGPFEGVGNENLDFLKGGLDFLGPF